LVNKDSDSLKLFLLEYDLDEFALKGLKAVFPDAWEFIKSKVRLKVTRLANAEKTFDEISHGNYANSRGDVATDIQIWHQRFLVKDDELLEFDVTGSHLNKFVAGHWQYLIPSKMSAEVAFLELPDYELPPIHEAIFLSNRADENWYHLLLDTLPRYVFMKNLPLDIPILIRDDLPATSKEFLKRLIKRPIIQIPPNSKLRVKRLHFIAARSTVFDAEQNTFGARVNFSPKTIGVMVSWIKETLNVEYLGESSTKLYIKRQSRQRRILNSNKISNIVAKTGLLTIEDNTDFYRNQIKIFLNLDAVISAGGAVLANLIFMVPGSKILCLRSWRQNELELWKKLAVAMNIEYFEIIGLPTYFGRKSLRREHSNYYIPPWKFRKTLEDVIVSKT
jgi:hypothetical protein